MRTVASRCVALMLGAGSIGLILLIAAKASGALPLVITDRCFAIANCKVGHARV
jgi:threonine dehydrogenase-like Zn-dependent dehydrogenase